jgi:hypothetical protein
MKKIIFTCGLIGMLILINSFTNSETSHELLTVKVTEKYYFSARHVTGSGIVVSEPGQEATEITALGELPTDNLQNQGIINKALNRITLKGWKLQSQSFGSNDIEQVTLYTFTK